MNDQRNDFENARVLQVKTTEKVKVKLLDALHVKNMGLVIDNAPAPPKLMTASDALNALASQLRDAVERGHTAASLAAVSVLQGQGLRVTTRSVTQALRHDNLDARRRASRVKKTVQ